MSAPPAPTAASPRPGDAADRVPPNGSPLAATLRRRRPLAERELVNSLRWLIKLRWLAGCTVVAATFLATGAFSVPLPARTLYAVGLGILLYNVALWGGLRWLRRHRPDAASAFEWFTRVQIGLDWMAMTVLLAGSGGAESPAVLFFLFHITIASLLLPHHHGFLYVTLAPVLVGGVALLEYVEVIPHVAIIQPARYRDPLYVGVVLVFFSASCYVMAYFCMAIARRLRRRQEELNGLYESMRDVTSTLEITAVLDGIVEAAARVLGCKAAAIRLLDRLGSQVEFAASWGLSERYREDVPEEFARSPLDQQTMRDGVVYVPDVDRDDRIWHPDVVRAEGIRSMLSVALVGRTGPMGVLRAYCARVDRFTEDDAAYLQAVAAHGVVAVENARAYGRLAELDRDKSKFLRITTHELRSPVRVTEGLMITLADGYAGPLTADQVDVVKRAQRRLAALHNLVDDLLDLAAGKADMTRVEREVVDLSAVVVQVAERFRAVAAQKGLSLSIDRPAGTLDFWCDRVDLDRIVNNLVSNAVKYTMRGGISVRLARDGRRVRFDITDSGIGIPEEAQAHLFDEFFRAANAKAVEESGTGLGLSIVRDLVERHGGRISVASQEGQGTTVEVSFPAAERPPSA